MIPITEFVDSEKLQVFKYFSFSLVFLGILSHSWKLGQKNTGDF